MQNQTVKEAFRAWIPLFIPTKHSPAMSAAMRVFESLIEPVIGQLQCRGLDRESSMQLIMRRASAVQTGAGAYANFLLCQMMEDFKLWPRSIFPFEAFSPRSSMDIPLSPLDVADLVCKMPAAYRSMIHMVLLTGIKPQQLVNMGKREFLLMVERMDARTNRSEELFEMHIAGSHNPIYLSLPIINKIRSQVARLPDDESRVFATTTAKINHAWARYASEAPQLTRFKATAGTHLIRHGGDAHVLSANLGIALSSAEIMFERLSPLIDQAQLKQA